MIELRECPCCGKPGQIKHTHKLYLHGWVGCPDCGLYIQWHNEPSGAVEKWNRRAGPRMCITCTFSHWQGCTLHCRGQKLDPVTPPADSCEAWAPQA